MDDAHELFSTRLGSGRTDAEPAAVTALAAACARLPLALAVVTARAAARPRQQLADLAAQLAGSTLSTLASGDPRTDPRTVFSWSYRALPPDAARMFRLLGLHPGAELSTVAAASLAAVSMGHANALMSELAAANLVTERPPTGWAIHDLLHSYAATLTAWDPAEERNGAYRRMLDHYLHVANTAALLLNPKRDPIELAPPAAGAIVEAPADPEKARAWFTAEHHNLTQAVSLAAAEGFDTYAWHLARSVTTYLMHLGRWADLANVHTIGLAAARRTADRQGQIHTLRGLGLATVRQDRLDEAHALYTEAVDLCAVVDDRTKWGHIHRDLAELLGGQGRYLEAIEHIKLAATVDDQDDGNVAGMLGWCYAQVGDYDLALLHSRQAVTLSEKDGDRWTSAAAWDSLGHVQHQLGDYQQALGAYGNALALIREVGDRYREAEALDHIAESHQAAGNAEAARAARHQAETIRRQT